MCKAFYITIRFAEISHLKFKDVKGDRLYINGQYLLTTSMNDDLSFEENRYENVDHVKGYQREGYRYILLVPEAQKIIELVRKYHPPRSDDDYIFRRMVDGEEKQLSISTFNSKIKKECRIAGIPERTSHKIRFSTASILHSSGIDLATLQRFLGHSRLSTTCSYIRPVVDDKDIRAIMDKTL